MRQPNNFVNIAIPQPLAVDAGRIAACGIMLAMLKPICGDCLILPLAAMQPAFGPVKRFAKR